MAIENMLISCLPARPSGMALFNLLRMQETRDLVSTYGKVTEDGGWRIWSMRDESLVEDGGLEPCNQSNSHQPRPIVSRRLASLPRN